MGRDFGEIISLVLHVHRFYIVGIYKYWKAKAFEMCQKNITLNKECFEVYFHFVRVKDLGSR